eukprot:TRINITY_DN9204_c0_g1_i1.p1 TRINITY_DN9204_c0_g1~~TRINITY_DN9204_c0_g1_i1.p1  ORF type:complete len:148 (-),score=29.12 TRINITY_DN9204_c0_g1_i1:686-1099(-)
MFSAYSPRALPHWHNCYSSSSLEYNKERCKKYYQLNKEKRATKMKSYYIHNRAWLATRMKDYYNRTKEKTCVNHKLFKMLSKSCGKKPESRALEKKKETCNSERKDRKKAIKRLSEQKRKREVTDFVLEHSHILRVS